MVKGIKDKIFFNTVLAHTCTIQSRIRPKNTMVHFTGILLSYKKTTELCCYLVSKGPRCPNLATELVLCRVYICNWQLIIPPPNALDNEKSVNPNLLKNQLNQQFKILDTN